MKKLYENFSVNSEHMDVPAWVWLELSPADETNIQVAQQFLKSGTQFQSVSLQYQGAYDTAELEGKWRSPSLTVTASGVWFSDVEDWTGSRYEFNLTDTVEDPTYTFNEAGEVVEVGTEDDTE